MYGGHNLGKGRRERGRWRCANIANTQGRSFTLLHDIPLLTHPACGYITAYVRRGNLLGICLAARVSNRRESPFTHLILAQKRRKPRQSANNNSTSFYKWRGLYLQLLIPPKCVDTYFSWLEDAQKVGVGAFWFFFKNTIHCIKTLAPKLSGLCCIHKLKVA